MGSVRERYRVGGRAHLREQFGDGRVGDFVEDADAGSLATDHSVGAEESQGVGDGGVFAAAGFRAAFIVF
jgi:hypothetical protein